MPDYSVVIPAFDAARFIQAAIASLLGQSLPPAAIIVVDDGSTDDTGTLAARSDPRVRVMRQENRGQGAATTAGVALVETPLLAFLDADDLWMPTKAARQIARLEAEPQLDCLFGHLYRMRDGEAVDTEHRQAHWGRTTMMIRTEAFRRVGPVVDMPNLHGDMIDWIDRARQIGVRMELMDDVLAVRRVHKDSLTYRRGGERGYLAAVKAGLDRRRAAGGWNAVGGGA